MSANVFWNLPGNGQPLRNQLSVAWQRITDDVPGTNLAWHHHMFDTEHAELLILIHVQFMAHIFCMVGNGVQITSTLWKEEKYN